MKGVKAAKLVGDTMVDPEDMGRYSNIAMYWLLFCLIDKICALIESRDTYMYVT